MFKFCYFCIVAIFVFHIFIYFLHTQRHWLSNRHTLSNIWFRYMFMLGFYRFINIEINLVSQFVNSWKKWPFGKYKMFIIYYLCTDLGQISSWAKKKEERLLSSQIWKYKWLWNRKTYNVSLVNFKCGWPSLFWKYIFCKYVLFVCLLAWSHRANQVSSRMVISTQDWIFEAVD